MNKQIIIIIGLPCSGKSNLCDKFNLNGYDIFDDFIFTFYDGKLMSQLISGKKICLTDPRLCDYTLFQKYVTLFEKYIKRENIHIILFENDYVKCINNAKKRDDKRKQIENTIMKYSKIYSISNYVNWNHDLLDVYFRG